MVIQYYGLESFKVTVGNTTVALNPISKKSQHKSASFGADIVLVSLDHSDMNGIDVVSRGEKEPFVITGPGEYEVRDVFVRGFASETKYDNKVSTNTVYLIKMEDMWLCFLGALAAPVLPDDLKVLLEEVDILFVPIGGNGVLSPKDAHAVSVHVEPHIVIPMHYKDKELTMFLKEEGESDNKGLEKFTFKKKDLVGKSGEVVVLRSA